MLSLLGSWVAAASTGAIAAWVLSFIRERWNRPVLEVQIDLERGSVVETGTQEAQQKYARLVVHNRGRTLAKNCCGSVDYIKRTDPTLPRYPVRRRTRAWSVMCSVLRLQRLRRKSASRGQAVEKIHQQRSLARSSLPFEPLLQYA
jgi:hypothetical protein